MPSYQDYGQMLRDFYAKQGPAPTEPYYDPQAAVSGYSQAPGYDAAQKAYQDYNSKTGQSWLDSLPAAQQAEYQALSQQRRDALHRKSNMGAVLAAGLPLAAAAAGPMLGALGGAGDASGLGALGAANGSWDILPSVIGGGSAATGGAGGLGALGAANGSWDILPSVIGGGGIGDVAGSGLLGQLGGIDKLGSSLGTIGSTVGKIVGGSSGSGSSLGSLLGGVGLGAAGLGLLNAYNNRNSMPSAPNYMNLANMTGASANPNQTNAQGDTLNWQVNPTTGQRTQTIKYGAKNQAAYDQNQQLMQALRSQIAKPAAALPAMPTYKAGNFQQVNPNAVWGN
jgi:hypothetical protein